MKLKTLANQACIVICSAGRGMLSNRKNKSKDKRNIIIVFNQIFGDAIVFSSAFEEYAKLYPNNQGYRVLFLARPSVISFISEVLSVPENIELKAVNFDKLVKDYSYYRQVIDEYRNFVDLIIVPGTSLSGEIFTSSCNASKKVGLVRSFPVKRPLVMALFPKIAYTHVVVPDKKLMMLQRQRLLLKYLGAKEYKAKLPTLLSKEKIISEAHYCVLCPGSSKMEKCWPTERFSEVIDFIIDQYDMNIHLCGGADEIEFEKLIISRVKNPERVISHIGKTSFSDWSAIVQHADLVIGNDSATMHLAAASQRKAICIAGVYDKYQFFPYKVDVLEPGNRLPVTLIKEMPCEWCRTRGYNAGFGNDNCKKQIDANKCALCIDAISVTEVEDTINKIMKE